MYCELEGVLFLILIIFINAYFKSKFTCYCNMVNLDFISSLPEALPFKANYEEGREQYPLT